MVKTYLLLGFILLSLMVYGVGGGFRTKELPDCSDLWAVGKILPKDYRGCRADGVDQDLTSAVCHDGSELEAYDRFWAFRGGPVRAATTAGAVSGTAAFGADVTRCRAGR